MKIRNIVETDIPAVITLLQEFAAFENLSHAFEITEARLRIAMFGDAGFVEGLIAEDGETAAGYALFYPSFASFRGQRGVFLEDIYVKPEHRGKGIGEAMLKEIASIAAARGFERIDFQVLDWNTPAIQFYKNLGAEFNDEATHFKFTDEAFAQLAS